MVQLYNPNIVGKHILVDIKNISSDKLKLVEDIKPFLDKLVEELARLRVDISVIVDRLEVSIKMSGDPYHEEIYSMLVEKLLVPQWLESVNKKLSIIQDLYSVYQDRLVGIRGEMLTVVIIVLVAIEAVLAFLHLRG